MFDKELIERILALTCTWEDVEVSADTIAYDKEHPFRKYYRFSAIKGAFEKYLSGEWNDRMLAQWSCIYCWILLGGCDYEHITEDLNSLERFLRDVITYNLDGVSFFDEEYSLEQESTPSRWLEGFAHLDHIWQTLSEWLVVYAMIGPCAEENGDQYATLINDTRKEYMILFSDHLENGFEDEHFQFLSEKEHFALMDKLEKDGYTIIPHSEEFYQMTREDIDA